MRQARWRGLSTNGNIDPITGSPEVEAVVWKDAEIVRLGTFGGYESACSGVDDQGEAAGWYTTITPDPFSILGLGAQMRSFIWQNGVMRDLGTLGGPDAITTLINNRGQIAGISYTQSTPIPSPVTGRPTTHPFLWENGEMKDLGTLGGTNAGFGAALWLNNRGELVGDSNLAGDLTFHPTLWNGKSLIDLGTLGGDFGSALWVNDSEEVVGFAANRDQQFRAFLWKNNVMIPLGTLGDDPCSIAWSINARGQVVGTSEGCDFSNARGFLWQKGEMIDLNDFVPQSANLTLVEPHYINDRGEIVGLAVLNNQAELFPVFRSFLLIPCDGSTTNEECVVRNASATRQGLPSVRRQTITAQGGISPSEMITAFRARTAQRYHIPGLGTPRD